MTKTEAERGLAIRHYPGKWRSALQIAGREWHVTHPRYWREVRKAFLELGGLFIHQLLPHQQAQYPAPKPSEPAKQLQPR